MGNYYLSEIIRFNGEDGMWEHSHVLLVRVTFDLIFFGKYCTVFNKSLKIFVIPHIVMHLNETIRLIENAYRTLL